MSVNRPLKIAIIGYGKMGREIEKHAPESGCSVEVVIDQPHEWQQHQEKIKSVDVAIEFTAPHVVVGNLHRLMDMNIPVVTGTTGWMSQLSEIEQYCKQRNGSLFYASNFSVGVNLFFALNRYLAQLMASYPEYKAELDETHHTQKLDAPSGTAVSMIDDLIRHNSIYKGWRFDHEGVQADEIAVRAHRIEGVTGTHKLVYKSAIDSISIEHIANNRQGFAKGALLAARWLADKKGVFTMNDLLKL